MTFYLIALLGMAGVIVRDAWTDRSRPTLAWWAHRRTVAERRESVVVIRGGRTSTDSLRSGVTQNGD